jgi:hypothetical protein
MTKRALILACGAYTGRLAKLPSAVPDSERLEAILAKPGIGDFAVKTVLNPNLVSAQTAVHELLVGAASDDFALMYLSGHGVKDAYGRFYLALPRTKVTALAATALSGRFIREQIADTASRRLVVILDTCFAGAFGRDMIAKSITAATGVPEELTQPQGHVVMAASSSFQYAFETMGDQPSSVFTSTICEGLESGAADLDGDGWVSLDDLFVFTVEKMREQSTAQTPEINYLGVTSPILISRVPRIRKTAELGNDISAALESVHGELRMAAVEVLGKYTSSANRARRTAARARLRTLRKDEDSGVRQLATRFLAQNLISERRLAVEFSVGSSAHSGDQWALVDAKRLRLAGQRMPQFSSLDESMPSLQLISLTLDDVNLEITSTDRYQLDWVQLRARSKGAEPFSELIPADYFAALKLLPRRGGVRVEVGKDEVIFSTSNKYLAAPRVSASFPETARIVAARGPTCLVERAPLIDAIETVTANQGDPFYEPVNLRLPSQADPTIQVSVDLPERGLEASAVAHGDMAGVTIRLNPRYLLDGLDSFDEEKILLSVSDSPKVFLMIDRERQPTHKHVIAPIRPPDKTDVPSSDK